MRHNILVIRFGSLGDIVLTSATILNLKLAYPDSHVTYLTKGRFEPVVRLIRGVDEIITLPEGQDSESYYQFVLGLDKHNFDLLIDLHGNIRSWTARKLISSGISLSYPKRRSDRWLLVRQKRKTYPEVWPHTIDLYNSVLDKLRVPAYCSRPVLRRPEGWPHKAFSGNTAGYIVIAPGAAHPPKQWPVERFEEVARQVHGQFGVSIVWPVMGPDAGKSRLEKGLPEGSFHELVDWPVERLVSVISGARLMISNDSGLMHVASAVGTPVVAIFGPTHPALGFAPRGLFDRIVETDEPCRPCSLHGKAPCYRTEQFCFTRITPNQVAEEVNILLQRPLGKALFLDRDGTVMVDKHYLADPSQVELIPGVPEALCRARKAGWKLVLLSNQSGVARGMFGVSAVDAVQARLAELLAQSGITLDGVAYCPHYAGGTVPEFAIRCDCRKPFPGMAEKAAVQLGINLHSSVVIGDKADDIKLGHVIGAESILVRTGHGRDTERTIGQGFLAEGIRVYDSLPEAVPYI